MTCTDYINKFNNN